MSCGPPVKIWTSGGRWTPRLRWWADAHHVPEQRRLTWFYPDFGSYVAKEYVTPEQLAARAHGVERQAAAKAHKEGKQPIAQQMKTAQKQAEEHRGQTVPKKSAPNRDER